MSNRGDSALSDAPRLFINVLEGGSGMQESFDIVLSGDMVTKFSEGYKLELSEGGPSRNPHVLKYDFKGGKFDTCEFTLTLFSGCRTSSRILNTGREIVQLANSLANLSKPSFSGGAFSVSPLCMVSIGKMGGNWWRAKGFFVSSTVVFRGGFDVDGFPTIVDVSLTFSRHFGTHRRPATTADFQQKVSCYAYVFSGG